MIEFWALVAAVIGCTIASKTWVGSQRLRRAEFIRTYRWPHGLLGKLSDKHPDVVRKDAALVSRGDELPNETYHADGTPIDADVMEKLRAAYAAESRKFAWQD